LPGALLPGFLSVSRLIFGSIFFSFQAQILAPVHCAFVPDNDSMAYNILLDFSFGFTREVTGLILGHRPSYLEEFLIGSHSHPLVGSSGPSPIKDTPPPLSWVAGF
jgi:hypothetical protein